MVAAAAGLVRPACASAARRVGAPRAYTRAIGSLEDIGAFPAQRIWDGIAARAIHGDRVTVAVVELDPGVHLPEHAHDHEQLGLVIEGGITFTVGGETRTLGPGGTWRIPSNAPHSADVGPDGAVVVDVFAPVREDWKEAQRTGGAALRWPPR